MVSLFSTTNRYETRTKKTIRNRVISAAKHHPPRRALTLPSKEAFCAKLLKEAYQCEVVGIELEAEVVTAYDGNELDHFYHGNVLNLGSTSFAKKSWEPAVGGHMRPVLERSKVGIGGKFDFMFIDLTSLIGNEEYGTRLQHIVERYAEPKATIAITFTRTHDFSEEQEDIYLGNICPDWEMKVHRYLNKVSTKTSSMLTAVYTR